MYLKSQPQNMAKPRGSRHGGFTLVEAMVSLAVLIVTGVSGVSGFVLLNRFASDNRDRSAARVLCQERIEQMLTIPFRPQKGSIPTVVGQDGVTYYLLGQTSDYNPASGAYTGVAGQVTSNEAVTIFKQADGTGVVTGTRTTSISNPGIGDVVCGTVTVTYKLRGQANTYTLYTLRATD